MMNINNYKFNNRINDFNLKIIDKKTNNLFFKNLSVFLLIYISTQTSDFSASSSLSRPILVGLVCLFFYYDLKIEKKFLYFTLVYFLFGFLLFVKFNNTKSFQDFFFFYIDKLLIAYLTIKITGKYFFIIFEKIVYTWSLFIAPFYLLQLYIPNDIYSLNKSIATLLNISKSGMSSNSYSNSFLFTFVKDIHFERNCGFMWEPGAFGAMLIISFVIYLYFNKFLLNIKTILYLILIISTFSTTAYLNLILILSIYFFNSTNNNKIKFLPIFFILIISFLYFTSSVVFEKIGFQLDTIDNNLNLLNNNGAELVKLDRFSSLIYLLPDIYNNFILGTGWAIVDKTSKLVNLSNGLALYLVMFGIVGMFLMIINLYKTFNIIFIDNKIQSIFFVLIILNISFSNPVLILPFFVSLQLYSYVDFKKKLKTKNKFKYNVIK